MRAPKILARLATAAGLLAAAGLAVTPPALAAAGLAVTPPATAASIVRLAGTGPTAGTRPAAKIPPLCGTRAGQKPHITKVMWIFMENRSYGKGKSEIPGSPQDPYIAHQLTGHCGSTSDYHAVTHPSYPNYLAATSGGSRVTGAASLRYFTVKNIFGQADPSWRSYQEYMPVGCDHVAQTVLHGHYYVGRHNPAASYSSLPVGAPRAGDCRKYDEPLGTAKSGALVRDVRTGKLPRFSFVTPGLCDDMHQAAPCPQLSEATAAGDSWLRKWIPVITAGPDYRRGDLVIDITWDEGNGGANGANCLTSSAVNCLVPDIVISPYTRHVVSAADFSHYSLLKTTEKLLHLRYLGAAARQDTRTMCRPFGLC